MSNHYKQMVIKYEHSLDTMWSLFKFGRDREKAMEAKLNQVKIICEHTSTDALDRLREIRQIVTDDRNGVGV